MKDAIIILTGGINQDGSLPDLPKKRADVGVELYKNKVAPRIIITGKYGFWLDYKKEIPPRTEAMAMREYILSLGVPEGDLILEETSKDTVGNAYFTKVDILEKHNWKDVVVVTSEFHIPRTRFIFDIVLGPDYKIEYVSAPDNLTPEERQFHKLKEEKTIEVLRETILKINPGDSSAVKNLLYTMHPGYSDNPSITFEQLMKRLDR